MLVEGVRAVTEVLNAGAVVSFAVVSPRLLQTDAGVELGARLLPYEPAEVTDCELCDVSDTDHPQGVLVVCQEPVYSVADIPHSGRVLVLDGVRNPGNVGTLVRSAVAFGVDTIVCLEGTVDPWGAKAVRASAGMVFRLPVVQCGGSEGMAALKERDIPILVASAEGNSVWGDRFQAFGLVVGNEVGGVRARLRERAEATIAVDMKGDAESLNVGIAGSILMHALTKKGE